MRNFARITLLSGSLVLGALAIGACGGSVAAEPATAQSAASTAPVGTNTHGPVKLVGDALGTVALRPEQRTELEQLATAAETRHESMRTARNELTEAIALQIDAGKIDRAALQPKIDATTQAFDAVRPGDRAALERVHAILDASQREKLVDALQAQIKGKKGDHNPRAAMQEWATDLKLTDAQRDQIKTLIKTQLHKGGDAHHDGHHGGHGGKVLEAFKGDRFVMDEVAPATDAHAKSQEMSGRFLGMAEQILPILTPEQRTLAAGKIRAKSATMEDHMGGL